MKKILLLLVVLVSSVTFAQNNGITYQAVIYSTSGESVPGIKNSNSPLSNKAICLQFSIVDENTQTEYQEKVTVTTDDFGMVNLVIGKGTQTGGYANSFNAIVWSNPNKYLKVSVDQTGNCSSFELISDQILTYVPFALSANSATSVSGIVGIANGGTNATTVLGAKTNLQLQNVDNTSDLNKPLSTATQTALNTKVEKVAGKDLSTEDFTTAEKTKLASLGGTPDLSSYATLVNLNTKVDKVAGKDLSTEDFTTAEKTKLASLGGTPDLSSYATLVNLNTKVDKVTGKNLSTNDYTTAEKTKLASISGVNTGDQDLSSFVPFNGAINSVNLGSKNLSASNLYGGRINDLNIGIKGTGETNYLGSAALAFSSGGFANTAIGHYTLTETQGNENTAIGAQAMRSSTTGSLNTALGRASLNGNLSGSKNTALGAYTRVLTSNLTNTTAIGYGAIANTSNTIQLGNTDIIGVNTSGKLTTGTITLPNTDGTSGQVLTTNGSGVVAWSSPASINTSNFVDVTTNQIIAGNKLFNSDIIVNGLKIGNGGGSQSTVIGDSANGTLDDNTALGFMTLDGNSGTNNTAVGTNSMRNSGTTSMNTSVGVNSGTSVNSGNGNTYVGHNANVVNNSAISNATAIGANAIVTASNTIQLGADGTNGTTPISSVKTSGKLTTGSITLPNTDGTTGQVLTTNGSGVADWSSPASISISSINGNSNVNGAIINNGALSLTPADATNGGIVTTGNQTFSGNKNISGNLTTSSLLTETLDQIFTAQNNISAMPGGGQTNIWQSFTAGRSGLLSKVSMEFYQPTASGTLYIYSGQGTGGSLLTSQSFSISSPNNDYSFIDFVLSTPVNVTNGSVYTMSFVCNSGVLNVWISDGSYGSPLYSSGASYYGNAQGSALNNTSIDFKTYVGSSSGGNIVASGTITTGALTYPNVDGTSGQVLATNGAGLVGWTSPTSTSVNTHSVGEAYGGGIVFFTYDNGAHGLIAGDGGNLTYKWSTAITPIAARSTGVLGGKNNSMLILSKMGIEVSKYAAQAANEYSATSNGITFGDWYLPSMDEMCLLKNFCVANSSNILTSGREYWTSNDDDLRSDGVAWQFVYNGGATVCNDPGHRVQWRSVLNYIVPIRAF